MFNQFNQRHQSGFLSHSPVVRFLIFICIGIFLFEFLLQTVLISTLGVLYPPKVLEQFEIWRFLTFQFLHADFSHIIGNMISLYFFGPILERWFGSKRFLTYYLACGAFGGLLFLFLSQYDLIKTGELLGASGGLFGIMVGVAMLNPQLKVQLMLLPFTLTMKQLALGLLSIAAVVILMDGPNAGGEACHLGGAILGYLLMKKPELLSIFDSRGSSSAQVKKSREGQRPYTAKIKPRTFVEVEEDSEVDRILDKISNEGLHSLTEEERDILKRSAKK